MQCIKQVRMCCYCVVLLVYCYILVYMMISSTLQLNDFANREGVKTVDQLLPRLIESKELVSANIARLVTGTLAQNKPLHEEP